MADVEEAKRRDRSPNFPFISLETALRRAHEFYAHEKRGSAPFEVAARHWQYSPSSSGAVQTVAALKQYGLMSDEGSGKQRKVRLTEMALRIIIDQREGSIERIQYMRQAATTPPVIGEIYQHWPDTLPSEPTLRHHLVMERQFNDTTANKAVKILRENHDFTGIGADGMLSELSKQGEDSMSEPGLLGGTEVTTIDTPTSRATMDRVRDALLKQQFGDRRARSLGSMAATSGCTIYLLADGPVTQDALKKLIKYVELIQDSFPESEPKAEPNKTD